MLLILVRHGETLWNTQGKYQGRKDSPLTETGLNHAKKIGDYLKENNFEIKKIYTSPIKRAFETASIIGEKINLKPIKEDLLKEIDYGLFEGRTFTEISEKFPKEAKERKEGKYSFVSPEGESYKHMDKERIKPFLEKIMEIHANDTVLVVSHSGPCRLILGRILKLPAKEMMKLSQPNECIYFIETSREKKPDLNYYCVDSCKKGKTYFKAKC